MHKACNSPLVSAGCVRKPWTSPYLRSVMILTLVGLAATLVLAQDKPDATKVPDAPSQSAASQTATPAGGFETGIGFVDLLQKKSLFFPNIATSKKPLTSEQKFKLFVDNSISGSAFLGSLAGAGLGQAFNSPEGYGQGGEGYAKRFGASMARNASNQFFGTWLLASALHQDPRFFVKPTSDIRVAVRWAIVRTFVTRDDRTGKGVTNWSGLLGPLAGEALANTYMPPDAQTVGKTFERYGTDIGVQAGANILRQYWPTLMKDLHLTRASSSTSTPAPTPKN